MPIVVKMKPGTDPVSAELTIDGIVFWYYLFRSPDHDYRAGGTSNDPITLPLGSPEKLHLEPHAWTLHVTNQTSSTVSYSVQVRFIQGTNQIGEWPEKGPEKRQLKPQEEAILDDRAVLVLTPPETGVH